MYHAVTDVAILRFMVEVCWGPMLAALSVTLDQSDDRLSISHCLLGFRHAVHVTAVMGMQTQRDAFVTSMAKFTNLHCAADMKQKNVDAVKVSACLLHNNAAIVNIVFFDKIMEQIDAPLEDQRVKLAAYLFILFILLPVPTKLN